MNKRRISLSFARRFPQYHRGATVQRDIACKLAASLRAHAPHLRVDRALEIGVGTGFLTQLLTQHYPLADWWFNDLVPEALDWIPKELQHAHKLIGDAETLPFPPSLDLLASASALQWFEDSPGFIRKSYNALKEGGILAISAFGEKNFIELKELLGTGLRYPTLQQWQTWVRQAGFHILAASEWLCRPTFPSARELLGHLRSTGVNGIASARIVSPRQLLAFEHRYRLVFATSSGDNNLPLTYHPLMILAQKSPQQEERRASPTR